MTAKHEDITAILEGNRAWAASLEQQQPGIFRRLAAGQEPKFLWIGCADSRVPASQVTGLLPGDVFEHRNIANLVPQADINCMSLIDFAITHLKIPQVIVCGHYGCAGVRAAMEDSVVGNLGTWLEPVRRLHSRHKHDLDKLEPDAAAARLCELNVLEQVQSLCQTDIIAAAWQRGQQVAVHGFIYALDEGLLKYLDVTVASPDDLARP